MASFVPGKVKRKGFDEIYDDFSDLSVSAPASKIRRLNAELPPIIEERYPIASSVFEHQVLKGHMDDALPGAVSIMKETVLPPTVNEERALVLYKPIHSHYNSSLKMDPELLTGLKNPAFWPGYQNLEEDFVEEQKSTANNCLAVVPWFPSQFSAPALEISTSESGTMAELMEVGADGESMEIDGDQGQLVDASVGPGSFLHWQQHCMIPDHTHIPSSPVLGSW